MIEYLHLFCNTYVIFQWFDTIICILVSTGGNGYINDYASGRLLRDSKLYEIGAGTSEIRRLIIGRSLNKEYS